MRQLGIEAVAEPDAHAYTGELCGAGKPGRGYS